MNTTPTSTSQNSSRIMHFLRFIETLDHIEVILFNKINLLRKHDRNNNSGTTQSRLEFCEIN